LSVSILIDHEVHFEGEGPSLKRVLVPPAPERIKSIQDLAAAAVGLNPERGDKLIVESLPFESTQNLDPLPTALPAAKSTKKQIIPEKIQQLDPKIQIGIAVGLLVVLAGIVFLLRGKRKPREATVKAQTAPMLPAPSMAN